MQMIIIIQQQCYYLFIVTGTPVLLDQIFNILVSWGVLPTVWGNNTLKPSIGMPVVVIVVVVETSSTSKIQSYTREDLKKSQWWASKARNYNMQQIEKIAWGNLSGSARGMCGPKKVVQHIFYYYQGQEPPGTLWERCFMQMTVLWLLWKEFWFMDKCYYR